MAFLRKYNTRFRFHRTPCSMRALLRSAIRPGLSPFNHASRKIAQNRSIRLCMIPEYINISLTMNSQYRDKWTIMEKQDAEHLHPEKKTPLQR